MNVQNFLKVSMVVILSSSFSGCVRFAVKNGQGMSEVSVPAKVISDDRVVGLFTEKASDYYMKHDGTQAIDYQKKLVNDSCHVELIQANKNALCSGSLYNRAKNGVLIFGSLFNCGKCPKDHLLTSSAFLISKDGICVTNYHVFKSLNPNEPTNYETAFVMNYQGDVFPVVEVLAGSKEDDLAVFKINTRGKHLQPLSLGKDQEPGAGIHVISHPDSRFYTYANGHVGRSYIRRGTTSQRQTITAEFARGSSGAPVLDNRGNVAGLVAGTVNIYYRPNGEHFQMTVKDIIPVSRLHKLLNGSEPN